MPQLQPQITRIASGGTDSYPGTNLYMPNVQDASGAHNFNGDVFARNPTNPLEAYIELNVQQGSPQIAVVAPSTATTSFSMNTTDASGTVRSFFQINEEIDPVVGPKATMFLQDTTSGSPGTTKGFINFVSSFNNNVGGVYIGNQGNTSGIAVGQDITINTAANRFINVPQGTLSVSSLAVSSMVGAFTPYGMSTMVAGINATTIPIASQIPLSKDIPVIAGNTYRVSALVGFQNLDPTTTSYTQLYILGTGQPVLPILTTVYCPTNTTLNTGTYSCVFNALTTGNAQIIAQNTSPTNTTTLTFNAGPNPSSVPFWVVENLGPIGTIPPP